MGMSLAEYGVGKAGNIAMGGLLDEGKGAPVVTSSGNTVSAMEAAVQAALDPDNEYSP